MFTCKFNDCTRITTHRSMSALFLCIYLYIYIYFFFQCPVPSFLQIGCFVHISGRRFHIDSSTFVLGWCLLLCPPVCPLLWLLHLCSVVPHTRTHTHKHTHIYPFSFRSDNPTHQMKSRLPLLSDPWFLSWSSSSFDAQRKEIHIHLMLLHAHT